MPLNQPPEKTTSSVRRSTAGSLVLGRHNRVHGCMCNLYELILYAAAAGNDVSQLSVPVFSLATVNEDGSTNMNIVTYASPVGIKPEPLWMISLYKVWSAIVAFSFRPCGTSVLQDDACSSPSRKVEF